MEEGPLQRAIMDAILKVAEQNADILKNLKLHIGMAMEGGESEDKSLGIQIRLAEIDTEFKRLLKEVASNISLDTFDDTQMSELMNEKHRLEQQLAHYEDTKQKRENTKSRLDEIFTVMEGLKNHPLTYDDKIVRQILECVIVESKEKIKVVFIGGMEVEQELG